MDQDFCIGFILGPAPPPLPPHLPKLHIFKKPTIDKFFLVNGLGGIIPPYKAKRNRISKSLWRLGMT